MGRIIMCNEPGMTARISPWFALVRPGVAGLMTTALLAQEPPARFPLTPAQVAVAIKAAQLPVEGVQIRIAARISASVSDPVLELRSMSLLSPHSAQLRMACQNHVDCLPFYVSVVWPEESEAVVVPDALSRTTLRSKKISTTGSATQDSLARSDHQAAERIVGNEAEPEPTLRNGTHATLIIEDGRIHIRLKVVCLESGAMGARVRVTTTDRKQAYVAEILTPTTLKGSL